MIFKEKKKKKKNKKRRLEILKHLNQVFLTK